MRQLIFSGTLSQATFQDGLADFLTTLLLNPINSPIVFNLEQHILDNELTGVLYDPAMLALRSAINTELVHLLDTLKLQEKLRPNRPPTQLQAAELSGNRVILHFRENGRTFVHLTWPAPLAISEPDEQIAMGLLFDILNHRQGPLWQNIQEEKGLAYSIEGYLDHSLPFGYLAIQIPFLPEDSVLGISMVRQEVAAICEASFETALLEECRESFRESLVEEWEGNAERYKWIATDIQERKALYTLDDWLTPLQSMTGDYIAKVASRYLRDNHLTITTVGHTKELEGVEFWR